MKHCKPDVGLLAKVRGACQQRYKEKWRCRYIQCSCVICLACYPVTAHATGFVTEVGKLIVVAVVTRCRKRCDDWKEEFEDETSDQLPWNLSKPIHFTWLRKQSIYFLHLCLPYILVSWFFWRCLKGCRGGALGCQHHFLFHTWYF